MTKIELFRRKCDENEKSTLNCKTFVTYRGIKHNFRDKKNQIC